MKSCQNVSELVIVDSDDLAHAKGTSVRGKYLSRFVCVLFASSVSRILSVTRKNPIKVFMVGPLLSFAFQTKTAILHAIWNWFLSLMPRRFSVE